MPVRNQEAWVATALSSVLAQTHTAIEVHDSIRARPAPLAKDDPDCTEPEVMLEEGVNRLAEWYRTNREWARKVATAG